MLINHLLLLGLSRQSPYLLSCKWPWSHFLIRAGFNQITLINHTLLSVHMGTQF